MAKQGVAARIIERQTATGTKDKIAQHWIDILLEKSRKLKRENPSRTPQSISEELNTWLVEQPGEKINPLLVMPGPYSISSVFLNGSLTCNASGLDITQDTPVEILHTVLLGIIKYAWYNLHTSWKDPQQDLFVVRLQSTDLSGLSIPPIRATYMLQYRNNLIGKHFKSLMQTAVFHLHDIVSSEQFLLWKALGSLGAMLWMHEIDNMALYLVGISFTGI